MEGGDIKLHYSTASPYVRKVMVVAHETGQADGLVLEDRKMTPVSSDPSLDHDNPLGKIPALVTPDGETLYDSRVICEYLDDLHDRARLFPEPGPRRWTALRRQALADGILDAAVGARYESVLRPERLRWPAWVDGQLGKIDRALDAIAHECTAFGGPVDIGLISVGVALAYLDFRYPELAWRGGRDRLDAWLTEFARRPSMLATTPRELQ